MNKYELTTRTYATATHNRTQTLQLDNTHHTHETRWTAARKSTRNQAAQADESEQKGASDGVQAKGGHESEGRTEQCGI